LAKSERELAILIPWQSLELDLRGFYLVLAPEKMGKGARGAFAGGREEPQLTLRKQKRKKEEC